MSISKASIIWDIRGPLDANKDIFFGLIKGNY